MMSLLSRASRNRNRKRLKKVVVVGASSSTSTSNLRNKRVFFSSHMPPSRLRRMVAASRLQVREELAQEVPTTLRRIQLEWRLLPWRAGGALMALYFAGAFVCSAVVVGLDVQGTTGSSTLCTEFIVWFGAQMVLALGASASLSAGLLVMPAIAVRGSACRSIGAAALLSCGLSLSFLCVAVGLTAYSLVDYDEKYCRAESHGLAQGAATALFAAHLVFAVLAACVATAVTFVLMGRVQSQALAGASPRIIRAFTTETEWRGTADGDASSDDGPSCAVCLGQFEEAEKIRSLLCGHSFHSECIEEWLKQSRVCPLCRSWLDEER